MSKKKALYIDIDGTLARFHDADKMFIEAMWTQGFYIGLKPFENLIEGIKLFKAAHPEVELFTLSAVLDTDPPFVVGEKNAWLDKFLPEIDAAHRIFTRAGEDKSGYLDMEAMQCFLLDDYNKNLYEFEAAGGHPIKFRNDINHRGLGEFGGNKGSLWEGDMIHYDRGPKKICSDLREIIFGRTLNYIENFIEPDDVPPKEEEGPDNWIDGGDGPDEDDGPDGPGGFDGSGGASLPGRDGSDDLMPGLCLSELLCVDDVISDASGRSGGTEMETDPDRMEIG